MKKFTRRFIWGGLALFIAAAGFLAYISYRTSIPIGELVNEAPSLISSLQSAPIDSDYIKNYASGGQKILDVLYYDINIDLYPEQKIIKGDVIIKIAVKGVEKIDLNLYDNFKLKAVKLNGMPIKYENIGTRLTLFPPEKLKDTCTAEIIYEGEPKNMGFGSFNFGEKDGKSFIYTMNEPVFASTWFPCNDIPSDKAIFDIKITNDSSKVSVSNGKLISVSVNGGRKTYHWRTLYPLATYLTALYSADYINYNEEYISSSKIKMPVSYYVTREKAENSKFDFFIHKEAISILSKLFGEYPFIKEKYGVAEFLWNKGALENQTITGIGSVFISGMGLYKDLLVHELAHSWWGNAVGLKDWKDIWLNEGFATYSTALYYEALTDKRALFSTMRTFSGDFSKSALYNPSQDLFSRLIYNKGAWTLHMLRKEAGDSSFFKILRKYYNDFKYKNASTEDFKSVCESVLKRNMSSFFNQWVYKGKGIIEAEYDFAVSQSGAGENNVKLNLTQIQKGWPVYAFAIDLKLISADGAAEVKTVYVTKKESHFELKTGLLPKEIIPDPDGWLLAKFKKK